MVDQVKSWFVACWFLISLSFSDSACAMQLAGGGCSSSSGYGLFRAREREREEREKRDSREIPEIRGQDDQPRAAGSLPGPSN